MCHRCVIIKARDGVPETTHEATYDKFEPHWSCLYLLLQLLYRNQSPAHCHAAYLCESPPCSLTLWKQTAKTCKTALPSLVTNTVVLQLDNIGVSWPIIIHPSHDPIHLLVCFEAMCIIYTLHPWGSHRMTIQFCWPLGKAHKLKGCKG